MKIAVVVPVLNEASYIESCLNNILQQLPADAAVFVSDGGSIDGTPKIVRDIASSDSRVHLVLNPGRIQSIGVNIAAKMALSRYRLLLRLDAHSRYPTHYVSSLLKAHAEHPSQSVVVPMSTVGVGPIQRAIAAAQNSMIGNGGSAHRRSGHSHYVDHGHHALFDLDAFMSIGGYDESFTHNEDFEFDYRLRSAGGKIWLCQEACIDYFPRSTFSSLAMQYVRYGRGRAKTMQKHKMRLKLRQVLPVIVLTACVTGLMISVLWWPAILVPVMYLLLCLVWGAALALRLRDPAVLLSGPASITMHLSWALGFLQGLSTALSERLKSILLRNSARRRSREFAGR